MASSPDDLDDQSTQPIDYEQPQPAVHGQVHVGAGVADHRRDAVAKQMAEHLRQHVEHANTTAQYHGGQRQPGDIGQSSEGGFTGSGTSGEYQTTSTGNTGDADSGS